jgi:hypothetical protein
MKLKDYKAKINSYFQNITTDALIELFEDLGYLFTDFYSSDVVYHLDNIKVRLHRYFISITPDEFHELGYEFLDSDSSVVK